MKNRILQAPRGACVLFACAIGLVANRLASRQAEASAPQAEERATRESEPSNQGQTLTTLARENERKTALEQTNEEALDEIVRPTEATYRGALLTLEMLPIEQIRRPITLPLGVWEIEGGFGVDLSAGVAGERLTLGGGVRYGLLPFWDFGVWLITGDIRNVEASTGVRLNARRSVLSWLALSASGTAENSNQQVDGASNASGTVSRLSTAVGTPIRLRLSRSFAIEGAHTLMSLTATPRNVQFSLPAELVVQTSQATSLAAGATTIWDRGASRHLSVAAAAKATLAFGNRADLEIVFRFGDIRETTDLRELTVALRVRM